MGKPGRKGDQAEQAGPPTVKKPEDLPIYAHRESILQHIRDHRVTHIQGETGCGKSTQVPKYILEDAEEAHKRGDSDGRTKIIVTQPRRMAAITLAKRVASELDEDIGSTVGYAISGERVSGKLCFATTGFLLQVLVNQPEEFGTYTHIILDEVHERSVDADLLTMLLKLLMQVYPTVKLIVMSATLQARLFAAYFKCLEEGLLGQRGRRAAPSLDILPKPIFVGVRTYPVQEIFLDEIENHYDVSGVSARRGMDKALRGFAGMGGRKGKGGKDDKGGKGKGDKGNGKGKGGKDTASGFKRLEPQIAEGLDELCKELITQMARETCTLIVFLPGIADITSFYETLAPLDGARQEKREPQTRSSFSENWRDNDNSWRTTTKDQDAANTASTEPVSLRIFPMHSLIPREEQEEVFNEPPKGICHVVLASNIAESSLTLPSVCGIIDLAMRRSIQYDARRLMSCLVTTWCSQSSCKQRSGRSGRTMPGVAVRMVTRPFFDTQMVEFDPPEMLNAPLTKLYLQAKQLCYKLDHMYNSGLIPDDIDMDLTTPQLLLGEVVQPPSTLLVDAAITELAAVGCIDRATEDASITPLGYIAMALPCELRLCRLLYFGLTLGCEADAIAMVSGLTASDPFSSPSLLVLKDEREYVKKLERSFGARRRCDHGRYSEPLMLRDLFAEWIQVGAPRGPKAMGSFARDWNIIPKKFEAMITEAVDICTRMVKLLNPRSSGHYSIQRLLSTMRFSVDKREELTKAMYPTNDEYSKLFSEDVTMLRALLALSFSDQMLLSLKPRWTPSGGKKRKEEQLLDIINKQGLDPAGTVIMMNPPHECRQNGESEENYQRLCEALCGERCKRPYYDEKERLLFLDFRGPAKPAGGRRKGRKEEEDWREEDIAYDGPPVINDVCSQAHLLHQFGAGRWKFSVENFCPSAYGQQWGGGGWGGGGNQWGQGYEAYQEEGQEEAEEEQRAGTLELFKPLQPFLINWEVLQNAPADSGGKGGGKKGGGKKPSAVKAMPDWRNPLGYACHVVKDGPPQELLGICASVQGLESGASAFIAGATVLGLNHLPLLLATLDVTKWQIQFGFDAETYEVKAIKIMHYEIALPPETLTIDMLQKLNALRSKMLEIMSPWEEEEEEPQYNQKGKGGKQSKGHRARTIWVGDISEEIASILEEVWETPDPVQNVKKQNLYWTNAADEEVSETLSLLQPLTEEPDWYYEPGAGNGKSSSSKAPKEKKQKQQKSGGGANGALPQRQGVKGEEYKKLNQVVEYLRSQPKNEGKLSKVCGSFYISPKAMQKYPEFLQIDKAGKGGQENVRLVGASGGGSNWTASGSGNNWQASQSKKGSGKGGGGGKSGGFGGKGSGAGKGGSNLEVHITKFVSTSGVPCLETDFDRVVKQWIREFERRRGPKYVQEAFEHLAKWTSKKERDQVKKWNAYIMVLLRNWESDEFDDERDARPLQ